MHYVRAGAVPAGDTILMYDLGKTYVAVQGMQGSNVVGDLWVTYEIELKKPVISSNVSVSQVYRNRFAGYSPAAGYFAGASSGAVGNLPLELSGFSIEFPPGLVGIFDIMLIVSPSTTFAATNGSLAGNPMFGQMEPNPDGIDGYGLFIAGTTMTTGVGVGPLHYAISVLKRDRNTVGAVVLPALSGFTGNTAYCDVVVTYTGPFTE